MRRALFWHGFGETATGGFVHPSADLEMVMEGLASEGLEAVRGHLMPMVAVNARAPHCASDIDMVQKAWNLSDMASSYAGFLNQYEPIRDALLAGNQEEVSEEDAFLVRTLLIHGARSAILAAKRRAVGHEHSWLGKLLDRRHSNIAAVALANKNARTVWALLAHGRDFDPAYVPVSGVA